MDEQGSSTMKVLEEMAKRQDLERGGFAFKIGKTFRWNWDDTIARLLTKLFHKGEEK
jgi:hypothetical protein